MEGYSVKISDSSIENMSVRDKIKFTTCNGVLIKDIVKEHGNLIIRPLEWVDLSVHNESSKNKDYTVFLIIDEEGTIYQTSSTSLRDSFMNIYNPMKEAGERFEINVYTLPSKNNEQGFLTCDLV